MIFRFGVAEDKNTATDEDLATNPVKPLFKQSDICVQSETGFLICNWLPLGELLEALLLPETSHVTTSGFFWYGAPML